MQFIGQLKDLESSDLALYLHIPFCKSKCHYCSFTTFVKDKSIIVKYFNKLISELKEIKKLNLNFKTLYIGGGNPLTLGLDNLIFLINLAKENTNIKEISIECNSFDIDTKVLEKLNNKINRLSIGFQALDNNALKTIGRNSSVDENLKALESINKTDINYDINIDFICNIKNHETKKLIKEIDKVIESNKVNHLSIYSLTLEENTKLFSSSYVEKEEAEQEKELEKVWKHLEKKGFNHYEISAFSKNKECVHNKMYWNLDPYLGLGVSSASYINKVFTTCTNDLDLYLNSENFSCYKSEEKLSNLQELETYIMVKLRTFEGVNLDYIKKRFNVNYKNNLLSIDKKYYIFSNNIFKFNSKGMLLSDFLIFKIISYK